MSEIRKYLVEDKKRILALVAALVGLALLFIPASSSKKGEENAEDLSSYKSVLEDELAELCSSIDGVGKCRVSVTFSEGERKEYKSGNVVSSAPPKVLGITVVCEGGDKIEVKRSLSECLTALFDIGSNRVCIQKLEK